MKVLTIRSVGDSLKIDVLFVNHLIDNVLVDLVGANHTVHNYTFFTHQSLPNYV